MAKPAAGTVHAPNRAMLGPVPVIWAKVLLWVLGLLPLVRWLVLGVTGGLGANPAEFLIRSSGTFTLVALLLTLTISPLRQLTGWPWVRLRRLCGLFVFFYGSLHLAGYLAFDQWFDWPAIVQDAWQRPLIAVGWLAWLGLLALAITSPQAAMRRLGRRWQTLHRAIYLIVLLALLHFWLHRAGKNDFAEVWWYAAAGVLLLAWRFWGWWRRRSAGSVRQR